MPNFFLDNHDIRFLFDHIRSAGDSRRLQESHAENGDADMHRSMTRTRSTITGGLIEIVGAVSADTIAPNAEDGGSGGQYTQR